MPVLKSLSFTALPKSGNDPGHSRRAKFVARLEEQGIPSKRDPRPEPAAAKAPEEAAPEPEPSGAPEPL